MNRTTLSIIILAPFLLDATASAQTARGEVTFMSQGVYVAPRFDSGFNNGGLQAFPGPWTYATSASSATTSHSADIALQPGSGSGHVSMQGTHIGLAVSDIYAQYDDVITITSSGMLRIGADAWATATGSPGLRAGGGATLTLFDTTGTTQYSAAGSSSPDTPWVAVTAGQQFRLTFLVAGHVHFTPFDEQNQVIFDPRPCDATAEFFGLAMIALGDGANYTTLTGHTYAVPAPGAVALLGLGATIGCRRRRS